MSKNRRLYKLLDNYLNDTCSNSEMEELFKLIKKAENETVFKEFFSDYWQELSERKKYMIRGSGMNNEDWFREIYSEALAKGGVPSIHSEIKEKGKQKQRSHSYNSKHSHLIKVAALLMIPLFVYLFYQTVSEHVPVQELVYKQKISEPGEKIRFQLPDGTQVHLNSESSLVFPESFETNRREVQLEGEAYFVVAHEESWPFLVHTEKVTTRVLGTSFNIRSYPEEGLVSVAVVSGKVALSNQETLVDKDHQVFLKANEWANYSSKTHNFSTGSGDISSFTAWNNNVLLYHGKTFGEVAQQLERWYGVTITFQNKEFKGCVIYGEHSNEPLVNVLDAITYAFEIDYQIEGRSVVFSGKGCR